LRWDWKRTLLAVPAWLRFTRGGCNAQFRAQRQYRTLQEAVAESELDPSRDEGRHTMLLTLLAEEMAKDLKAKDVKGPLDS
jgi:hypothetical protein